MSEKTANPSKKSTAKTTWAGRSRGTYIFSFVVLVIIVVAFVVFPMNTPFGGTHSSLYMGSYDGEDIEATTGSYFTKVLNSYLAQFEQQATSSGQARSAQQQQYDTLQAYALAYQEAVKQAAIVHLAAKVDLTASDSLVSDTLGASDTFKNLLKKYGKINDQIIAKGTGIRRIDHEKMERDDLVSTKVLSDLSQLAPMSEEEKTFIASGIQKWRGIELVKLTSNEYPDSEVKTWATQNKELFQSRELSSITVASKDSAAAIYAKLKDKTTSFEKAVKDSSTDAYKASEGKRGSTTFNDLSFQVSDKASAQAVFALAPGAFSEPVALPSGSYAIFRADSEVVQADFSKSAELSAAREYIVSKNYSVIETWLSNEARTLVADAKATSLTAAAAKYKVTIQATKPFPLNNGGMPHPIYGTYLPLLPNIQTTDNKELSELQSNPTFFEKVFALKKGEIADPLVLSDAVYIIRLKDEVDIAKDDLETFTATIPDTVASAVRQDIGDTVIDKSKWNDNFSKAIEPLYQAATAASN